MLIIFNLQLLSKPVVIFVFFALLYSMISNVYSLFFHFWSLH